VPTTVRIALLAGLLALLSNLAVLGFIYYRTHNEAVSTVRRQVIEQGAVLSDVYRSGGKAALLDGIEDTLTYADPQTAVALFDPKGNEMIGNVANNSAGPQPLREGYRNALIRLRGQTTPHEAAIVIHRLPNGQWLLSGRIFGEGLALTETLERSLVISVLLAVLLGLACGVILAQYVGQRVRDIATVAQRISGRDLTERVPLSGLGDAFDGLAQQFNAMLDRISSLMAELRLLTDSLAHDLRSPVSRLRAAAHAAAETDDAKEQEELLGKVIQQADALIRILSAAIEISRSEAQTGRNQFSWFDAGELTAELTEMYEPVAEEAGAPLRYAMPERAVPLFGHRQLLAQAVSNLVENAIRYGASGGAIEVAVDRADGKVRIEVADHGPGIPAELRSEARKRFGRLDASRSDEGAGLGLALAEAIAHLHDGQLRLEDNHPGLLTMLELPLHAGSPPAEPKPRQPAASDA
jgi:signal transduction histidine kinase